MVQYVVDEVRVDACAQGFEPEVHDAVQHPSLAVTRHAAHLHYHYHQQHYHYQRDGTHHVVAGQQLLVHLQVLGHGHEAGVAFKAHLTLGGAHAQRVVAYGVLVLGVLRHGVQRLAPLAGGGVIIPDEFQAFVHLLGPQGGAARLPVGQHGRHVAVMTAHVLQLQPLGAQMLLHVCAGLHVGEIIFGKSQQRIGLDVLARVQVEVGHVGAAEIPLPFQFRPVHQECVELQEQMQRLGILFLHEVVVPPVVEVMEPVVGRHYGQILGGSVPPPAALVEVKQLGIGRGESDVLRHPVAVGKFCRVRHLDGASEPEGAEVVIAVVAVGPGQVEICVRLGRGVMQAGEFLDGLLVIVDVGVRVVGEACVIPCARGMDFPLQQTAHRRAWYPCQIAVD